MDWLDSNGYPTEAAERVVKEWPLEDFRGLLTFVRNLWRYSELWTERTTQDVQDKPVTEFLVSTGGWSGNESLIYALKENRMFWMMCWVQSRRGGHYIFELRA